MSWSTKGWNDVMLGVCSRANQMTKEVGLGVELTLLNHQFTVEACEVRWASLYYFYCAICSTLVHMQGFY